MGTNYYYHRPQCHHCGEPKKRLHIGKASGGWTFLLCQHPDLGISTLEDWEKFWVQHKGTIRDEYGTNVEPQDMSRLIVSGCPLRNGQIRRHIGCESTSHLPYDAVDHEFS